MRNHPAIGGLPLCLGGNVFGWTLDRDGGFAILDAFYEAGGRMIDTAEAYSAWVPGNQGGESEAVIGAWMEDRGVRAHMRIGTKTRIAGPPGALGPDRVAAALERSLERLRTDHVDLYYPHRDDMVTPLDEVADAYDQVVRKGKARSIGLSNYGAERMAALVAITKARGSTPFTVLQSHYNLVERDVHEGPLAAQAAREDMILLPYYALAAGFLTGKFRSAADWAGTSRAGALDEFAQKGGWTVLAAMDDVAAATGASHAQIALAWLASKPGVAAPIASATRREQLDQLVGAVSLQLDPQHLEQLTTALG